MRIMTGLLSAVYSVIKFFTKTQNKVTFISRQSDTMSLDFLLLDKELKKRETDIKIVFLCRQLKKTFARTITYPFHMLKQMYHTASSKVVVLDSYSIVVSVLKHKDDLTVVQMWHSIGTMKKFGYTSIGLDEGSDEDTARIMKMHNNYDYVFAASPNYAEDLAAGFRCRMDRILIRPLPRVDLLLSEEYSTAIKEKIYDSYSQLGHKKNIVYCPTFRKEEEEHQKAIDDLIDSIDMQQYNLIIKLHPLSKIKINEEKVFTLSDFTSFDALFVADYVISDYSCIVYEAAIRSIPLFFYVFDFDEYESGRGLAIDLRNECPGRLTKDPHDIATQIQNGSYDKDGSINFASKYVQIRPNNSKDIVDFLLNLM